MCQIEGKISYDTIKRIIKAKRKSLTEELHAKQSEGKRRSVLRNDILPGSLSRNQGVARFPTIKGHDYLDAHLLRIGEADDPTCVHDDRPVRMYSSFDS